MKTTEENNKLIAKFMGLNEPFELPQHGTLRPDGNFKTEFTIDQLKYHTSWDWLMPVVREINKTEFDEWEGYGDLAIAVSSASIEDSYNRVIDAIEWHNQQDKL